MYTQVNRHDLLFGRGFNVWTLVCLLLWASSYAVAADDGVVKSEPVERWPQYPREEPRPCDQVYFSEHEMIDATRERVEELVCRAALWVDGIGGKSGDVLAARRSHGHLEMSYYWSQFGGPEFRTRAKVRVELPLLKRRLSAFVGLDNQDDFIQGRSEGFALRSEFPSLNRDDDWLGWVISFPAKVVFLARISGSAPNG